jgi:hypothetical protein
MFYLHKNKKHAKQSIRWIESETAIATSQGCLFVKLKGSRTRAIGDSKQEVGKEEGITFNDLDRNRIRLKICYFFFRNELPMLKSVLAVTNSGPDEPHFKIYTLHVILNKFCL